VIKRQLLQNGDDATLSKYTGQIQRLQKLQSFFPTATTALRTYAMPNISTAASNKKVSERKFKAYLPTESVSVSAQTYLLALLLSSSSSSPSPSSFK
jgi:hypothetical protein